MAGKVVTIKIYTSERNYESDMDRAKAALTKVKEAGISKGDVKINGINIKVEENISSGPI